MYSKKTNILMANIALLALSACGDTGEAQLSDSSPQTSGAAAQTTGTAAQPSSEEALPSGALRVRRAEIVDSQGFDRPIVAATMLIPADWQSRGGVVWNPQTQCGNGYRFDWSAAAPDGSTGLALIPAFAWATNSMGIATGSCPNLQFGSAQAYLQWLVQQQRPDARILDFRPREDLLAGSEALTQNERTATSEYRIWFDAGEVLFGYTTNGREMRGTAAAVVMFSQSRIADSFGGAMEYMTGSALTGYSFFAPDGELDFKVAENLRKTFQQAPDWSQRINAHNQQIARTNLEGARQRSQIIADTNREISQMQMDSWQRQQASGDRMQRETVEAIRGTETFNDPNAPGGTVELSNMYDHAWRMPDDTYVLTDDAFFNPADGVRLEAAQ